MTDTFNESEQRVDRALERVAVVFNNWLAQKLERLADFIET